MPRQKGGTAAQGHRIYSDFVFHRPPLEVHDTVPSPLPDRMDSPDTSGLASHSGSDIEPSGLSTITVSQASLAAVAHSASEPTCYSDAATHAAVDVPTGEAQASDQDTCRSRSASVASGRDHSRESSRDSRFGGLGARPRRPSIVGQAPGLDSGCQDLTPVFSCLALGPVGDWGGAALEPGERRRGPGGTGARRPHHPPRKHRWNLVRNLLLGQQEELEKAQESLRLVASKARSSEEGDQQQTTERPVWRGERPALGVALAAFRDITATKAGVSVGTAGTAGRALQSALHARAALLHKHPLAPAQESGANATGTLTPATEPEGPASDAQAAAVPPAVRLAADRLLHRGGAPPADATAGLRAPRLADVVALAQAAGWKALQASGEHGLDAAATAEPQVADDAGSVGAELDTGSVVMNCIVAPDFSSSGPSGSEPAGVADEDAGGLAAAVSSRVVATQAGDASGLAGEGMSGFDVEALRKAITGEEEDAPADLVDGVAAVAVPRSVAGQGGAGAVAAQGSAHESEDGSGGFGSSGSEANAEGTSAPAAAGAEGVEREEGTGRGGRAGGAGVASCWQPAVGPGRGGPASVESARRRPSPQSSAQPAAPAREPQELWVVEEPGMAVARTWLPVRGQHWGDRRPQSGSRAPPRAAAQQSKQPGRAPTPRLLPDLVAAAAVPRAGPLAEVECAMRSWRHSSPRHPRSLRAAAVADVASLASDESPGCSSCVPTAEAPAWPARPQWSARSDWSKLAAVENR